MTALRKQNVTGTLNAASLAVDGDVYKRQAVEYIKEVYSPIRRRLHDCIRTMFPGASTYQVFWTVLAKMCIRDRTSSMSGRTGLECSRQRS